MIIYFINGQNQINSYIELIMKIKKINNIINSTINKEKKRGKRKKE